MHNAIRLRHFVEGLLDSDNVAEELDALPDHIRPLVLDFVRNLYEDIRRTVLGPVTIENLEIYEKVNRLYDQVHQLDKGESVAFYRLHEWSIQDLALYYFYLVGPYPDNLTQLGREVLPKYGKSEESAKEFAIRFAGYRSKEKIKTGRNQVRILRAIGHMLFKAGSSNWQSPLYVADEIEREKKNNL